MPGVHVTVMSNIAVPAAITPTVISPMVSPTHDFLAPPPAPTPSKIMPCLEVPVPVMWPPGLALQQNKLSTTVLHKYQFIMLDGHDCGYLIPHVSIPPANLMLPIIIGFSSRKVLFSASTVKANGTPVGCSQALLFPVPMMTCASPVSMPTTTPPLNVLNNVTVGMTGGDIGAGIIAGALSMLADYVTNKLSDMKEMGFTNVFSPRFTKKLADAGLAKASAEAYGKLIGNAVGKLVGGSSIGSYAYKTAASALAGAAKIALTGEGSIKVSVGSNYAGGSVSYGRTTEGKNQYTAQGQVSGGPLASGSASAQHTSNPDGTTADQTATVVATPVGQRQSKDKTDYDASGKEKKTTESEVYAGGATAAPEVGGVAVHQTTETTTPGKPTQTSSGTLVGGGSPIGSTEFWGPSL